VEGGGWRVEGGGWRTEDGGWNKVSSSGGSGTVTNTGLHQLDTSCQVADKL
jgi:hypothetical protein